MADKKRSALVRLGENCGGTERVETAGKEAHAVGIDSLVSGTKQLEVLLPLRLTPRLKLKSIGVAREELQCFYERVGDARIGPPVGFKDGNPKYEISCPSVTPDVAAATARYGGIRGVHECCDANEIHS
jgi:hypothetical protein